VSATGLLGRIQHQNDHGEGLDFPGAPFAPSSPSEESAAQELLRRGLVEVVAGVSIDCDDECDDAAIPCYHITSAGRALLAAVDAGDAAACEKCRPREPGEIVEDLRRVREYLWRHLEEGGAPVRGQAALARLDAALIDLPQLEQLVHQPWPGPGTSPYHLIPSPDTTCSCGLPCTLLLAETWLPAFYLCKAGHVGHVGAGEVRASRTGEHGDDEEQEEQAAPAAAGGNDGQAAGR
jgi:hypothetical protein